MRTAKFLPTKLVQFTIIFIRRTTSIFNFYSEGGDKTHSNLGHPPAFSWHGVGSRGQMGQEMADSHHYKRYPFKGKLKVSLFIG